MAIHYKAIERGLKHARDFQRTASKEELLAFLRKANPPVPGLDPPLEMPKPRVRKAKVRKSTRRRKK